VGLFLIGCRSPELIDDYDGMDQERVERLVRGDADLIVIDTDHLFRVVGDGKWMCQCSPPPAAWTPTMPRAMSAIEPILRAVTGSRNQVIPTRAMRETPPPAQIEYATARSMRFAAKDRNATLRRYITTVAAVARGRVNPWDNFIGTAQPTSQRIATVSQT